MNATQTPKNILYRFAFSKIAVTVLIGVLCACLLISVVNDLFAFIKPEASLKLDISHSMSLGELSKLLQKEEIIENSLAFWIYAKLKNTEVSIYEFRGTANLNSNMGYSDILNQFK